MREHQEAPKPKCERISNKKVQASKALETSNFRKRLEILCCICMSVLDVCLYDWINMEKEKKTTVIFSQIWKQLEETKSFWYFFTIIVLYLWYFVVSNLHKMQGNLKTKLRQIVCDFPFPLPSPDVY